MAFKTQREIKFFIKGKTSKKVKVQTGEKFFELISKNIPSKKVKEKQFYKKRLLVKDLAKLTGVSPRTISSYRNYLSGQPMGKNDRKPPEKFIKKLNTIIKKYNKKKSSEKLYSTKEVVITVTDYSKPKFEDLIDKTQKKELINGIKNLGANYSYTHVKLTIKYFKKGGDIFYRYQSFTSYYKTGLEVLEQLQDYLASLKLNYIIKAEIIDIHFDVIGKK